MQRISASSAKAVIASTLFLLVATVGKGQPPPSERPDLWTTVQDSLVLSLESSAGICAANEISGAYTFLMPYDSICTIKYIFTEPWHNGIRLTLDHWRNQRYVNADEATLSFFSRTKSFTVESGDVIQFYREIDYRNPITGLKDTFNFFSRDTLDYAVELVSAYNMKRLVLLDSIGIMPQRPFPGKMRFYGPNNAMAVVKYTIPSWLDGDSVCMRVRVYARGSGSYYFTRFDNIKSTYAAAMRQHPAFLAQLAFLAEHCWTWIPLPDQDEPLEKAVLRMGETDKSSPKLLSVQQNKNGESKAIIRIAPTQDLGPLSLVIVDGQGKNISPAFLKTVDNSQEIAYQFPTNGVYIIGLFQGKSLLETVIINVNR